MKGRSESADFPKFPLKLGKLSNTGKWLGTKHNTKGWGGRNIGNATMMRMFKNLFWIAPYFSGNLDVLDLSKNILLLLNVLAIIRFCFTTVTEVLRELEFLQVISIFSY